LATIREYYRRGNDPGVIDAAITEIENSQYVPAKIEHNVAVLEAFRRGPQGRRLLTLRPTSRYALNIAGLDVRFAPDLVALENRRTGYVLYNFRVPDPTLEIGRTILELACHVTSSNG